MSSVKRSDFIVVAPAQIQLFDRVAYSATRFDTVNAV
jgi:hypothetical protein